MKSCRANSLPRRFGAPVPVVIASAANGWLPQGRPDLAADGRRWPTSESRGATDGAEERPKISRSDLCRMIHACHVQLCVGVRHGVSEARCLDQTICQRSGDQLGVAQEHERVAIVGGRAQVKSCARRHGQVERGLHREPKVKHDGI